MGETNESVATEAAERLETLAIAVCSVPDETASSTSLTTVLKVCVAFEPSVFSDTVIENCTLMEVLASR